ncbi:MAG: selenoneine biosynthesis selenosugar synthase SenB [Bryobacteraceae bacterium]
MRILIVSPAPPGIPTGNAITAGRWKRIIGSLGHSVAIASAYRAQRCDILVALHAVKSAESIERFSQRQPERPIVVALTGTDIYGAESIDPAMLDAASALVALQGEVELPRRFAHKLCVIPQSAEPSERRPAERDGCVAVVAAHLREVKDPMLAAKAARLLPATSRLRVEHYGRALDPAYAAEAKREQRSNPRYRWHGELPHAEVRKRIAAARVLVVSSKSEGGANVIAEAVVDGVPVLATRIPGNIGMLGRRYPGLFPPGGAHALAALLDRVESDPRFLARLRSSVARLAPRFHPHREMQAWQDLLGRMAAADGIPKPRPVRQRPRGAV